MIKKVIIVLVVIVVVIAAYIGYNHISNQNTEALPSISAVPTDASMIIESNNFIDLLSNLQNKSQIWNELTNTETVNNINLQINYLDSLLETNKTFKEYLSDSPVLISVHPTSSKNVNFLFLLSLPKGVTEDNTYNIVEKLVKANGEINDRLYNDVVVYDVVPKLRGKFENFSFSVDNGIFLFSFSSLLVEEAIRQLSTENSLAINQGFMKVQRTAGKNVDANIYINYKAFPKLLSIYLNNNYKESVRSFTNFANWSELDINIKKDAVLLNGFTYSNDSVNNYLNIFCNQDPQKLTIEEYLPDNTSTLIALGISDFQEFEKDYNMYLERSGSSVREKELNEVKEQYGFDIREVFYSFLEKEVALVYTDVSKDIDQSNYAVFLTKSRSLAEEKLLGALSLIAKTKQIDVSSYIDEYKIDEETTFPVYTMPVKYVAGKLFGNIFIKAETSYFSFIDNYLIFGSSKKALSKYIHSIVLHRTLKSDINYNQFTDNLSDKTNFYYYSNIANSPGLLSSYLSDNLRDDVAKNLSSLQKFQGIAIQFSSEKGMFYNNIYVHFNPVYKQKPRTIWESRLDTSINIKPRLVINHNTQDKEIFIQDHNNNIYLINSQGRILWKVPFDEEIISEIYQIDYYKNNKLQLLFSTKSKIHLIDRNGNYVERYPVRLRSKASNGISLFDYDGNREYRILVACVDKKVYAYSIEGNILSGWEFEKTESVVRKQIQHFRSEDKDFIVFSDSLNIYILDRRGNIRVKPESQPALSYNNNIFFDDKSKRSDARFVYTDTNGLVQNIYLDGKVEELVAGELSSMHYFDYKDVDGDGYNDLIFIDNDRIMVKRRNKKQIFDFVFDNKIMNQTMFYLFPGNVRKIGALDKITSEIYLLNSNGTLYEGFPLEGNTLFTIGHMSTSDTKFNLIVGSDDGFLYNYEVH